VCPTENKALILDDTLFKVSDVAVNNRFICVGDYDVICEGDYHDGCFSSLTKLQTLNHTDIFMHQLRINDEILDGNMKPTRVLGWMRRNADGWLKIIHINDKLEVSPNHLILTAKGYKFAGHLTSEDLIRERDEWVPVKTLSTDQARGIFAPYTESGTMLVNGYSVSCYSDFASHTLSHMLMTIQYHLGVMITSNIEVYQGFFNKVALRFTSIVPSTILFS